MAMTRFNPTGAPLIALRYFPTGGRDFGPGDHFPYKDMDITDRRVMQMSESRHIGPLTRDTYAAVRRQRGENFIGRGFTYDGLVSLGIIDEAPDGLRPAAGESGWEPDKADDVQRVGDFWLVGNKRGKSLRYEIYDLDGNRMSEKTFNGINNAKAEATAYQGALDAEKAKKAEADAAAAAAAEAAGEAKFADFPEDLKDWSTEQVLEFDNWFWDEGREADPEPGSLAPAATARYAELDTYAAMDDDALVALLKEDDLDPSGEETKRDLVELVLMTRSTRAADSDTSSDEDEDSADDSDVSSEPGPAT